MASKVRLEIPLVNSKVVAVVNASIMLISEFDGALKIFIGAYSLRPLIIVFRNSIAGEQLCLF